MFFYLIIYFKEPWFENLCLYLHSVRAVAAVIHGSWNSYNQCRDAVAHHVEVAAARVLALKHLHQHDVELHALQEHPGERRQEEEVKQGGKDGASNLQCVWQQEAEREEKEGGGEWSMTS